jgi:hypothetical protein
MVEKKKNGLRLYSSYRSCVPIHEEEKVPGEQGMDALFLSSLIPIIGSGARNLTANPQGYLLQRAHIREEESQEATGSYRTKSGTRMPRFTHSRRNS